MNDKISNQLVKHVHLLNAKANLLDVLMTAGFIKQSHLDYAMNQLDFDDQIILKEEMESFNDQLL